MGQYVQTAHNSPEKNVNTCELLASAELFKYIYYQQAFVLIISHSLEKGSTGILVHRYGDELILQ